MELDKYLPLILTAFTVLLTRSRNENRREEVDTETQSLVNRLLGEVRAELAEAQVRIAALEQDNTLLKTRIAALEATDKAKDAMLLERDRTIDDLRQQLEDCNKVKKAPVRRTRSRKTNDSI